MYIHAVELLELSGNGVENSNSYSGVAQYVVSVIAWNIPHPHPPAWSTTLGCIHEGKAE